MFLLIDPYVYQNYSQDEIKILNTVAHIITANNEDIDEDIVVKKVVELYKTGMHARALQLHVQAALKLVD